jgi:hypothetical protein
VQPGGGACGHEFIFQYHKYGCCCGAAIFVHEVTLVYCDCHLFYSKLLPVRYQNAINERLMAAIKLINARIIPGVNNRCLTL